MERKLIPIIGTISSGKSTFLDSFLGIELLQTGVLTTTKFVCIIKHSTKTSFYHVIPRRKKYIVFDKQGEEISDENDIKIKIENINEELDKKKATSKNDLFYMLETPIKNIKNIDLLEKCYFMDIPGLNEHGASYIDIIFSLLNINDILFEIIIFDATKIGQQNNIFANLEKKNCLKKEGNLYILNKIDRYTKGGDVIEDFQLAFYQEYEDEKKKGDLKIHINFSKNTFIPLISLLYQAETKFENDYYSTLLIELFHYLDNNLGTESFFEFIEKRLETIIKKNNIDVNKLEDEVEKISEEEIKIIKNDSNKISSEDLKAMLDTDKSIDLKFKKKEFKDILKKFYVIHKFKLNKNICFSDAYYKLENFISNINNDSNIASPLPIINYEKNNNKHSVQLLKDLNVFRKGKLKGHYNVLTSKLGVINENLTETKIRISFIGNISAGKSTIINSIIGEELLPVKDGECTYRAVIIKHRDINNFKLYKAKLNIVGKETSGEYYNFKEEDNPYCVGIEQIRTFLNNKNNDKKIDDNDAYIVIHGKLKIFDFIKLDNKYLNKIEFVDLPGLNKKNNTFIEKKGNELSFYDKIILFTNSIIFVSEPDSNDDENHVEDMKSEYKRNKNKLDIKLSQKAIETCIFVINKCDFLTNEKQKVQLKNKLKAYIKDIEKNIPPQWDNIEFFSGKCFNEFLQYYKLYVEYIDSNPFLLLNLLYKEWSKKLFYLKNFKNYIISSIENINKRLKLTDEDDEEDEEDEEKIKVPTEFINKIQKAFNELYKNKEKGVSSKDEKTIIIYLYRLYTQLKTKDFKNTNYSKLFFYKIRDVILKSAIIQKDIINITINKFFLEADQIFKANIEKEKKEEEQRKKNELMEAYNLFKNKIIPETKDYLITKENTIRNIIKDSKKKCSDLIENEETNASQRLKESDNDFDKASKKLEEKIRKIFDEMKNKQEIETNNILKEIIERCKKSIDSHYKNSISSSDIEMQKAQAMDMTVTLISASLTGVASGIGLVFLGSTVVSAVAAGTMAITTATTIVSSFFGPIGIAAGLGIGGLVAGIGYLYRWFTMDSKYKEALEKTKSNLNIKFDDYESNFGKNFYSFRNSLIEELNLKNEVLYKSIDEVEIPESEWKQIIADYNAQKEAIKRKIQQQIDFC